MPKYYVVWEGNEPGIYNSWTDCQLQIKGYPGARYKSFKTREQAEAAFAGSYEENITRKNKPTKPSSLPEEFRKEIEWDSISVDAACSGNPGKMEYQGVYTKDGAPIFHQAFPIGTNNIGEFLAIVHALAMFKKAGKDTPIYTDSRNAMIWVDKGKCRTRLQRTKSTEILFQVIERAEKWLANNTWKNKILKWQTDRWGEIPADFGRK
ncbi:MAG: ribonuclease H [Bacteroidetes bacterium]|nr:ribonuclease H [Bacteroidota bacterium]